jgi:hypothetical protein
VFVLLLSPARSLLNVPENFRCPFDAAPLLEALLDCVGTELALLVPELSCFLPRSWSDAFFGNGGGPIDPADSFLPLGVLGCEADAPASAASGPPRIAGLPPRLVAASGSGVMNFVLGTYGTGTHLVECGFTVPFLCSDFSGRSCVDFFRSSEMAVSGVGQDSASPTGGGIECSVVSVT